MRPVVASRRPSRSPSTPAMNSRSLTDRVMNLLHFATVLAAKLRLRAATHLLRDGGVSAGCLNPLILSETTDLDIIGNGTALLCIDISALLRSLLSFICAEELLVQAWLADPAIQDAPSPRSVACSPDSPVTSLLSQRLSVGRSPELQ